MRHIKNLFIISILISLCSCQSQKQGSILQKYIQEPIQEIQINPVPHPFHMMMPYAVWINGERVQMPRKDIILIAKELNLSLDPPDNTAELHNGAGWQKPLVRLN